MEKVEIYFKKDVEYFFNELVFDLFQKDYFGFIESAIIYKDKIIDFIQQNINTYPSRTTTHRLNALGSKYIVYKSNKRTSWYIFYEQKGTTFLVTFITNNHGKLATFL